MEYRMSCTVPPNSRQHRSQLVVNRSQQWSTECHALSLNSLDNTDHSWWSTGASNGVQNVMHCASKLWTTQITAGGQQEPAMEYRMSCTEPQMSRQHRSQLVVNRSQQWSTECHALSLNSLDNTDHSWWSIGASNGVQNAMHCASKL